MPQTHQYLALAALCAVICAAPAAASDSATITCSDWAMKYTSDPAVDFEAGFDAGDRIELNFTDGQVSGLVWPEPPAMFDPDVFKDQGGMSQRTSRPGADSLSVRRMSATRAETLTFTGLTTPAPRVFWQRIRAEDGAMYETFIVANCSVN